MTVDPAWIVAGVVSAVGGGVLASHIYEDHAYRKARQAEEAEFKALSDEVREALSAFKDKLK